MVELSAVDEQFGRPVLRRIGAQIPATAVFPPNIVDVHSAVQSIDIAYHINHRKGGVVMFDGQQGAMLEGIGHYGYERRADNRIRSRCNNPYPCEFDRGIIETMARRFRANAEVTHCVGECRRQGDEACEYEISWG